MTTIELGLEIDKLVRKAPRLWLSEVCLEVRSWPQGLHTDALIARLPGTHNADLAFQIAEIVRRGNGLMSWEALACSIEVCASAYSIWQSEQQIELLWSGPSPANSIPARRIDQVLYDLIASATNDILLVTFAAHKIKLLTGQLVAAIGRGVSVRLILEFQEESQNQLSMDALKAFPIDLTSKAKIYYWPLGVRERNEIGNPGKLHAKAAVVDNQALLSSANLTDDAFNRNLELGALFLGGEIPKRLRDHFEALISSSILVRWSSVGR